MQQRIIYLLYNYHTYFIISNIYHLCSYFYNGRIMIMKSCIKFSIKFSSENSFIVAMHGYIPDMMNTYVKFIGCCMH